MATITSVVQDEHKDESLENGGLAINLGEFEVSSSSVSHLGRFLKFDELEFHEELLMA